MGNSTLRIRDLLTLTTALGRLYEPIEPATFPNHLFDVLAQLLPGPIHSLDFVNLASGAMESGLTPEAASLAPAAQIETPFRQFAWQNPVLFHLTKGNPATIIQPADLIWQNQFRRTDFYQLAHKPLGIMHQAVAGLSWGGPYAGGFIVNKTTSRPFSARELELIQRLRPHVERAHTHGRLIADLSQKAASHPPPGAAAPGRKVWVQAGGLTRRETEVLRWVAEGKRDGEIALILGISPYTIHSHVAKILAKLNVETRTAAAACAHRLFAL